MKVGFTGLLALVFIVLNLTNYIDWSWIWVLSPLWIGLAIWDKDGWVLETFGLGRKIYFDEIVRFIVITD